MTTVINDNACIRGLGGGGTDVPFSSGTRRVVRYTENTTLLLSDLGAIIECDSPTPMTITIPTFGDVPYPVGMFADIVQIGAGSVTVVGAIGVTVESNGFVLDMPDSMGYLYRRDSVNNFVFSSSAGAGVPDGGTAGQALLKQSGIDGDATWQTLTKSLVGLSNVDNTSDVNKPVSTAQATADTNTLNSAKSYADSLVVGLFDFRGDTGVAAISNIVQLRGISSNAIKTVNLHGYYSPTLQDPSDAGGGIFIADPSDVLSEDNGVNIIVGNDGMRWKRKDTILTFAMAGCIGSGDDTTALQRLFAVLGAQGGTVVDYSGKTYTYTSAITCTAPNKTISIDSNCLLTSNTSVLTITGTVTQIGNVAVAAVKGAKVIVLSNSPTLAFGDLLAIQNSRINSLGIHRTYYYDGEMTTVASVAGADITMREPLETGYPSGVEDKVFQISPVILDIKGLRVVGNKSSACTIALAAYSKLDFSVSNLNNDAISNYALALDRVYMTDLIGGQYIKRGISGTGTDYGIVVANCQDLTLVPDYVYGARHAVATGGFDGLAAVPNRRIYIERAKLDNDPASLLHCADFHGNTIDSHYMECDSRGRITLSGVNCSSIRNKITCPPSDVRVPIQLAEVVGGRMASIGDTIISTSLASSVMAWGTSTDTAKVTQPCSFELIDVTIYAGVNLIGLISSFNLPQASQTIIDGFGFVGTYSTITRLLTHSAGTESVVPSFVQITRPKNAIADTVLYIAGDGLLTGVAKQVFTSTGSTATGTWVKNSDGSMVCRFRVLGTVAGNTAYAGAFKTDNIVWVYPKAFNTTAPTVIGSSADTLTVSMKTTTTTTSQTTVHGVNITSFSNGNVIFDVVAHGRHLS